MKPKSPEIRGIARLECRSLTDEEKSAGFIGAIRGSIPFNADSQVMQRRDKSGKIRPFVERIAPEAFTRSLAEDRDIVATAGHAEDPLSAFAILGENLTIETNERSMDWEAKVPDTQAGRDLMTLVEMGIIKGTSFEFLPRENGETWEKRGADMDVRTITDARLFEVNPVKWPAYLGTSLTVEMRGRYATPGAWDSRYDHYDSTVTGPVSYAQSMLQPLTAWLTNSLEFLRDQPDSTLAAFARKHVDQIAEQITELTAWLKDNGAELPEETSVAMRSLKDFRKECRQSAPIEEKSVCHWERQLAFMSKTPAV
jgi:HK97 family phage prohead protease